MTPHDAALFWLSEGVASVPLLYRSKKPAVAWTPYKSRLPVLAEIDIWYQWPRNLALVTGWQNLAILDFDSPDTYACWLTWQLMYQPAILDTYRVLSNRGIHVYYYLKEPVKLRSIQSALFEIKTNGRLCTTPPSVHESGRQYRSADDPTNIRQVGIEQILNYSPVEFAPIVFPLSHSKFAPAEPSACIEQIKEQISILSFFPNARQIDGDYWRADCPFHGHKDNFWISKKLNIGGCWTGCGTFDVISFFARLQQISNGDAIKELRKML